MYRHFEWDPLAQLSRAAFIIHRHLSRAVGASTMASFRDLSRSIASPHAIAQEDAAPRSLESRSRRGRHQTAQPVVATSFSGDSFTVTTRRSRATRGWQASAAAVGVAKQRAPPAPHETGHLMLGEIATFAVQ
jgi:hypothetical protein